MSTASDLQVISLPALEEQLATSHHEEEAARLWGFIIAKHHERVVVARIQQGVGVTLAAMQLWTRINLHQVTPGFLEQVG